MIVSFYDENFSGLQNNASLNVESKTYKLIKRPIELNDLTCTCEAFTENIQPTFLIIKDNKGRYVYGSLAGVPELNEKNQTKVNATDLKNILSSDIKIQPSTYSTVNQYISYLFTTYLDQIYQPFTIELNFKSYDGISSDITMGALYPSTDIAVVNCLEEIQTYLKFYGLYIDSSIDLINKKVIFTIGRTMLYNTNIKLWEYGIKNYGKWVASINECKGYYIDDNNNWTASSTWILTKNNEITTNTSLRDIFPVRRKILTDTESLLNVTTKTLTELLQSRYNENIKLNAINITPDFETNFAIYIKQGDAKYKDLPCGQLEYNDSGLVNFQIGFRYTDIKFI